MKKAILFGGGGKGRELYRLHKSEYEFLCFVDNDPTKQNRMQDGLPVCSPDALKTMQFDCVVVASVPGYSEILAQLEEINVPRNKIIDTYVSEYVVGRYAFLDSFAQMVYEKKIPGAVAECGVYRGEFAAAINRCFHDRRLYLFDTFEGFNASDIEYEKANGLSAFTAGDYGNTTVDIVLGKMTSPENCVIRKGFFPGTLEEKDMNERFCFVSLDVDLYLPTLEGLKFFFPRVSPGGVICIHDYFNLPGVKRAVDEYCDTEKSVLLPMGDKMSIVLAKVEL